VAPGAAGCLTLINVISVSRMQSAAITSSASAESNRAPAMTHVAAGPAKERIFCFRVRIGWVLGSGSNRPGEREERAVSA
jgi:hypothetical protein